MRVLSALAIVAALVMAVPAVAGAQNYPPPKDPKGKAKKKRGKAKTFIVCKKRGCKYRTIQKAVRRADGNDTIRVRNGTYREGVTITGSRYDGLKLIGNAKRPGKVKVRGANRRQNGVMVNNADGVTVRGFHFKGYKANCAFVTNVTGYTLDRLKAERCGVYGIYAFNSKGGRMTNSEAYYNNDAGFYVGQTPPQRGRKKRTIVRNVEAWGNVLGFSGTNMRYVTITKSKWFNNGAGIVPNALDTEEFPPPQENVIANNDIFWNNFNFYYGAPFEIPENSSAGFAYPIGVGVLLFGSQDTTVENNRFFGNWLGAFAMTPAVQLSGSDDPELREASVLRNNVVRNNDFGLGGNDLNGRDIVYDGSGTGNCVQGNTTRSPNLPSDGSTFAPCPGPADNADDPSVLSQALSWVLDASRDNPATYEAHWLRHPHQARKGYKPLERWTP
jgi:hypothetical protein